MFDHFTIAAPFYEHFARLLDPTRLRSYLGLPVAGRLLDAGGGTGRVAQALCGQADKIVVVDTSLGMLTQALSKECICAVRSPVERLPFGDATFARAIVVDAFHHFADHRAAIAELWRVLEPQGRLVIEEPNIETVAIKLIGFAERLALMRSRFYSPRDIAQMLQSHGAQVHIHDDHAFNTWIVADKVIS
jgi:demethylmenaquinone methyltransferase/2-methoxy-6-polyprenyl-1,4-benzoquinol methylase